MRAMKRRRPEFECLESMRLLSGVGGAAADAVVPNPLHLAGSVHGTYHVKGIVSTSKGSGSISPLGHVTESGKSLFLAGTGSDTMSTKQGKLFVDLSVRPLGSAFAGTYTIVGGTKAYAGETGSGNVLVTLVGTSTHGKYTSTYS